jgi:hypothetical protein
MMVLVSLLDPERCRAASIRAWPNSIRKTGEMRLVRLGIHQARAPDCRDEDATIDLSLVTLADAVYVARCFLLDYWKITRMMSGLCFTNSMLRPLFGDKELR